MKMFAVLLLMLNVFAQERSNRAPSPYSVTAPRRQAAEVTAAEDKCIVEGRVLNAKTGEPLGKAQVVLFREGAGGFREGAGGPVAAGTDASGNFRLVGIDPGQYRMSASRSGYARLDSERRAQGQPSPNLTLARGQHLKDITIRLYPAAVIAGRVTDEDGEPMLNARIQVLRYRYVGGRRQLIAVGGASTDDLGQYRAHSLAPGKYYVKASYEGNIPYAAISSGLPPEGTREGYAAVYYPGVYDPSQAALLQVREGEEYRAVDFRMIPVRTSRIRGRVTGPAGFMPQRANVLAVPRGLRIPERPLIARVNPNGTFELRGVPPGSYTVVAMYRSDAVSMGARRDVEVTDSIDELELALMPGANVSGAVRFENESDSKPSRDGIRLLFMAAEDIIAFTSTTAAVRPDGTFTATGLAEGDYRMRAMGLPVNYYVRTIRAGHADVPDSGLHVPGGGSVGSVEVVVSGDAGAVEGRAVGSDKKPQAGVSVVLMPSRAVRDEEYKTGMTDQNGGFSLKGVRPGDYTAFAFDGAEPGIWQEEEFLEPYRSKGVKVTVQPNGTQTAELEVIRLREQDQ